MGLGNFVWLKFSTLVKKWLFIDFVVAELSPCFLTESETATCIFCTIICHIHTGTSFEHSEHRPKLYQCELREGGGASTACQLISENSEHLRKCQIGSSAVFIMKKDSCF